MNQHNRPSTPSPTSTDPDTASGSRTLIEATPATSDFVCWLWAAFPPTNPGKGPSTAQAAEAIGVSRRTIQRWMKNPEPKHLPTGRRTMLARRAILRGRGHYLWPPADPVALDRSAAAKRHAEAAWANLRELGPTDRQKDTDVTDTHTVYLVHYRTAHAYGVISTRQDKHLARAVRRGADIVDQIDMPNLYAATILKHNVLESVAEWRCIVPRSLIPTGHTETWQDAGGPVNLKSHKPKRRAT